ncbi:MAG TPA: hypothetical protein VNJ01_03585 [Bacteriovoracaceae bacterium]|nr:hypothetical protein [Bacteriovoracaceae bacterium]
MKVIILLSTFLCLSAHAVSTYKLAAKCLPVEDSSITRVIGATTAVLSRAERNCQVLGKIAINHGPDFTQKNSYFPGVTMNFTCRKLALTATWEEAGCQGGIGAGYLLEVLVDIENPNHSLWYSPREEITYTNSPLWMKECQSDAQNFGWFSTSAVTTHSECHVVGKRIRRLSRIRFNN